LGEISEGNVLDPFILYEGGPKPYTMNRAHSFPRKNLTISAENLVNSKANRGNTNEIPWLTTATQVKFRGLIKS